MSTIPLRGHNQTVHEAIIITHTLGVHTVRTVRLRKKLDRPASFGRDKLRLGICWFKTCSTEHISRIWEMVNILERNGIYTKKIRTYRPGYVIYEDEWQLVAEPFRKGTMPRR